MATKKINHADILKKLMIQLDNATVNRESARIDWMQVRDDDGTSARELFRNYLDAKEEVKALEAQIEFHRIMSQEKKYAVCWLATDAHAYEIIEEKSDRVMTVRRLTATIKPEAIAALRESFVPGGFSGHTNNDLQAWDFAVCESNPIETIRKHKDGCWYNFGSRFTITAEPYEKYDYNF